MGLNKFGLLQEFAHRITILEKEVFMWKQHLKTIASPSNVLQKEVEDLKTELDSLKTRLTNLEKK